MSPKVIWFIEQATILGNLWSLAIVARMKKRMSMQKRQTFNSKSVYTKTKELLGELL